MNGRSISLRLIVAVLAVEALSAVLVTLLAYGYERHTHFVAFNVLLHGRAESLLGAVQDSEDPQDDVILDLSDVRLPSEDVWQVTDEGVGLLGRSANWNGPAADPEARWRDGLLRLRLNDHHYAVLALHGTRAVDPGTPHARVHQITVYYGSPTEHVWHSVYGAVEFYAGGSLLLLAVTGPLIAWLLHRGLLPLRQLASLAGKVSADSWQFTPPESARNTPELAPLTVAIESVLERLERAFKQQRVFVSDAAHELKTSVAVVKSSLQLLSLRQRTPEEYATGLDRCLADAERMETLVGRMLLLARVESADAEPGTEPACSMASCVTRAVEQLRPVAELRKVQIESSFDGAAGDVALLAEDAFSLASNLVLNAIEHSPPGAPVQIAIAQEGKEVILKVRDFGEGIAEATLPHIFDRFYRGDPSRARSTGGAGLGLAICKAMVDRCGGKITLENAAPAGVLAAVRLPVAPLCR
jgi:signal transduction histidine kinase